MESGKQFGTLFCSEAAANLHLDFGMAQVAFCLVIVEGHIKGTEEQADFFLQTCHTLNEGICLPLAFRPRFFSSCSTGGCSYLPTLIRRS